MIEKHVRPEHERQFTQFNELLSQYSDIRAIFGVGSYFSGDFKPNSDIDILVLCGEGEYTKSKTTIQGLLFETSVIEISNFIAMLRKGHKVFVPAINKGSVLYDPIGKAQEIKVLANKVFVNLAPRFDHKYRIEYSVSRTNTLFLDMIDASKEAVSFELLFGQFIISLHFMLCMHNRYWTLGVKHTIKELTLLLPSLADTLEQCYSGNDCSNRLVFAGQLRDMVYQELDCQDLDVNSLVLRD